MKRPVQCIRFRPYMDNGRSSTIHVVMNVPTQLLNYHKHILFALQYVSGSRTCASEFGIATRYGLDSPGIEPRYGARDFLLSIPVKTGSGA